MKGFRILNAGSPELGYFHAVKSAIQKKTDFEEIQKVIEENKEKIKPNDIEYHHHESLLHFAASRGKLEVFKALVSLDSYKGFDITTLETDCVETILHYAVDGGNVEFVKELLENHGFAKVIDKPSKDNNAMNFTALHFALKYGMTDIVKLLIDYGANPNIDVKNIICKKHEMEIRIAEQGLNTILKSAS